MSESNNSTVCTAASSVEATVNDVSAVKVNMELVNPPLRPLSALNGALASGDALAVTFANEEMFIKPRQVADPGPLGLAGFALTTFTLSIFNAGLLPKALEPTVVPLAFFYGGGVQLLAGMWEFCRGPAGTFGALAFSSYGGFWLSFAYFFSFILPGLAASGEANKAVGIFLLMWHFFTLYMTVASMRTTVPLFATFIVLNFAFFFLELGAFAPSLGCTKAGGWFGLICAALAWYASAAGVLKATWGRDLLPAPPMPKWFEPNKAK